MAEIRILEPGAEYHVGSRINRGEKIFENPRSRELFLQVVGQAKIKYKFLIRVFSLMGNHFHFILKPDESICLSKLLQWIKSVFARRWNKMMGLHGHVWQERFFSVIIRTVQMMEETIEYILKNPKKAGLPDDPEIWQHKHCGLWLQLRKLLRAFRAKPPLQQS